MTRFNFTRAGVLLTLAAIAIAVSAAAISLLLSSRLANQSALVNDQAEIMTVVADEAVESTEGFLRPAAQTSVLVKGLIESGRFEPTSGEAPGQEFLQVLDSSMSFDGVFVGDNDGTFLYVNRLVDDSDAKFGVKFIWFDDGERRVDLWTYDADLELVSTDEDPADSYDPRARPWFIAANEASAPIWTSPYVFFSSGLPGVTRAAPVFDDSGEITAVVGIDMRIAELSTFMQDRAPSENGAAFIMTRDTQMIAYPDVEQIGEDGQLRTSDALSDPAVNLAGTLVLGKALDRNDQRVIARPVDGEDSHFVFSPLESNPDWVLAVWSPDDDFLSAIRGTQRTNTYLALASGIALLAVLLASALWASRQLSMQDEQLQVRTAEAKRTTKQRDEAEFELAKTVKKLEDSNRDLEEYAYATAHDLRTPLRAIGGYSELIDRELTNTSPDLTRVSEWSQRIVEGYDRMGRTMDNLLDHARLAHQEIRLEVTPTRPVAENVVSDLQADLERVDGSVEIGDLPDAVVDPVRLARVFQNLLENAIRFRSPTRPLVIKIGGEEETSDVTFWVEDNGIGIAEDQSARVFELFNTTSRESNGFGVGLALVKRIITDQHGQVWVRSTPGEGSRFGFVLPRPKVATDDEQPAEVGSDRDGVADMTPEPTV